MKVKTRFLNPAWRQVAELTLQEHAERLREAQALLNDQSTALKTTYSFSSPGWLKSPEDRIAERVTSGLAGLLATGSDTEITHFTISKDTLRRWPHSTAGMMLSAQRKALIQALSHEFASAETLAARSGFKDALGVRQAVAKIKRNFMATFGLSTSLIEGREGYGYKLADEYSIVDNS